MVNTVIITKQKLKRERVIIRIAFKILIAVRLRVIELIISLAIYYRHQCNIGTAGVESDFSDRRSVGAYWKLRAIFASHITYNDNELPSML